MINTPWMKIINMDLQAMGEYSDFIQFTINTYKIYPLKVLCERLILNFSLRPKFLQEYYIIGACICICITCFLSTPTGSISAHSLGSLSIYVHMGDPCYILEFMQNLIIIYLAEPRFYTVSVGYGTLRLSGIVLWEEFRTKMSSDYIYIYSCQY